MPVQAHWPTLHLPPRVLGLGFRELGNMLHRGYMGILGLGLAGNARLCYMDPKP